MKNGKAPPPPKPSNPFTEFEQIVHALAQVPKSEITSPFAKPKKVPAKKRHAKVLRPRRAPLELRGLLAFFGLILLGVDRFG
jgi:hypothetical protein